MISHFLDVLGLQMKPVGPTCNIKCEYCYVEPFKGKMEQMGDEVLEKAISSLLSNSNNPTISWHGGEPMLAGLPFYERALAIIRDQQSLKVVRNQIQTNATLVTPEFAAFFKRNNFIVGVSLDGPREIHDCHRVDHGGNPTFDRVMKGVKTLREAGVSPSVTATVTQDSVRCAKQTFQFLVNEGFRQIRFSPVFEPESSGFGITAEGWGDYLVEIFDGWLELEDPEIHVRDLDLVMAWTLNQPIPLCTGNFGCLNWVSVDPSGNLYPCEYFKGEYTYGNIMQVDFSQVERTDSFRRYQALMVEAPKKCRECENLRFCGNGCSATRVINGRSDPRGVDAYCESKKTLLGHIRQVFMENQIEGGCI